MRSLLPSPPCLSLLLALAPLALAWGACAGGAAADDDDDDPPACGDAAATSVHVRVIDDQGNAFIGAFATMTPASDGIESPCGDAPDEPGGFLCGFDVAGDITVRATAPFAIPAEQLVQVGEDSAGCHVVTEDVTLTLQYGVGNG